MPVQITWTPGFAFYETPVVARILPEPGEILLPCMVTTGEVAWPRSIVVNDRGEGLIHPWPSPSDGEQDRSAPFQRAPG